MLLICLAWCRLDPANPISCSPCLLCCTRWYQILSLCMKSLSVTIEMKAIAQHFPVVHGGVHLGGRGLKTLVKRGSHVAAFPRSIYKLLSISAVGYIFSKTTGNLSFRPRTVEREEHASHAETWRARVCARVLSLNYPWTGRGATRICRGRFIVFMRKLYILINVEDDTIICIFLNVLWKRERNIEESRFKFKIPIIFTSEELNYLPSNTDLVKCLLFGVVTDQTIFIVEMSCLACRLPEPFSLASLGLVQTWWPQSWAWGGGVGGGGGRRGPCSPVLTQFYLCSLKVAFRFWCSLFPRHSFCSHVPSFIFLFFPCSQPYFPFVPVFPALFSFCSQLYCHFFLLFPII